MADTTQAGGVVGQIAQATANIPVIGGLPPMVRVAIIVVVVVLVILIILQCVFHMVDILPFCKQTTSESESTTQENTSTSS